MQHPTDPRWNSLLHLPELCKSCSHHRYSWRWWQEAPHAPSIVAEWPCCETMLLRPDPNEIQVEHWLVRLMWGWWCSQGVKPCIDWSRSRSNSKPKFLISCFYGHSNNQWPAVCISASVRAIKVLHIQQTLSRRTSLWPKTRSDTGWW